MLGWIQTLKFKKWGYNLGPKDILHIIWNTIAILAVVKLLTQLHEYWNWLDTWKYTEQFHRLTGDGCVIFSLVLVVAAFVTMIRTFAIARTIQKTSKWYSACGCRGSVNKVLYGICFVLAILGSMKLWSVTDTIYIHWLEMPHEYHIRAYVYLLENFGVVIIAWVITSYFKRVADCATKPRMYLTETAIDILTCIKKGFAARSEDESFADMVKQLATELRLGANPVIPTHGLKKAEK